MQLPNNRILLVEDYLDTQILLAFLLEDAGYHVTTSGSCTDAYRLAERELFDLYIIDGLLPDGTGLELCRQLRVFDPHTPIVFHSGLAYERNKQEAYAVGAQEYLAKPADPDEIIATVARVITQGQTRHPVIVSSVSDSFADTKCMLAHCH